MATQQVLRSALFVDFDNIYLGLAEQHPAAADLFATDPLRWLAWMEHQMPAEVDSPVTDGDAGAGGSADSLARRILVRRCYLNPHGFARYRPYFTRAGFQVIDCPSLTRENKNSADIHMVLDIVDSLTHATHFDEFIILSGDADFTPVVMRLRAFDRRTVMLAVGSVAAAYQASCDLVIPEERFIDHGLGFAGPRPERRAPEPTGSNRLMRDIADALYQQASVGGAVPAAEVPHILKAFPQFTPDSNWLGYFGLLPLTKALVASRPELALQGVDDDWYVIVQAPAAAVGTNDTAAPQPLAGAFRSGPAGDLRRRITTLVNDLVQQSAVPLDLAAAAQTVIDHLGELVLTSRWAGAGTFKALLESSADLRFEISPVTPGYLYDPTRHQPPVERATLPDIETTHPELASLARRLHQVADVPLLPPAAYRVVFESIAEVIAEEGYQLNVTAKSVRDRCLEHETPVARKEVTFILRGISYACPEPMDSLHAADDLADWFIANIDNLCDINQLELSDEERALLAVWIRGDAVADEPEPEPEPVLPADDIGSGG